MVRIPEIFKVRADNFSETMTGGSGTMSFKLPEYQRPYNWDKSNVQRLLLDCLNGLKEAASQPSPHHQYTFLGTIILTSDDHQESAFAGESRLVIDGQQRLTTLLLLSCALFVAINQHKDDIDKVTDTKTKKWLRAEVAEQTTRLYGCTIGKRHSLGETIPFPRMVRDEDARGHHPGESDYRSTIANFLKQFDLYCQNSDNSSKNRFPPSSKDDTDKHLLEIYRYIKATIEQFVYQGKVENQDDEFAPPVVKRNEFERRGCRDLYVKLKDAGQSSDGDKAVTHITKSCEAEGLVRLILFSSYLIQSVVLALVEAPGEDIAFDIFDALNTTGEPLTALETLKPHVVRLEHRYSDSESEELWRVLEENVMEPYARPDQRQKETKELVIGFALYYTGETIGADLKVQRNTLRRYFKMAQGHGNSVAKQIVRSLGDMAQFRRQFWDKEAIDALVGSPSQRTDYDTLKLCLRFIIDTKSSLIIPILARYWIAVGGLDDTGSENSFLGAVQAVTAFLVLRRAMTGGTARIDSDFRSIMSGSPDGCAPLCMGENMTNPILTISELKRGFRSFLKDRFKIDDKEGWLKQARDTALANKSSPICKFLLFAAAHNALPDENMPGMLTTQGVISSDERDFLNYRTWVEKKYATLEHVAPVSGRSHGWDASIYERDTWHMIGNLVLLPEKENQSIGNAPWNKKRLFYRALMAKQERDRERAIELAERQGVEFSQQTLSLLKAQNRLHMLDSLADVEEWTAEFIQERTKNILGLAWDQIALWLYE